MKHIQRGIVWSGLMMVLIAILLVSCQKDEIKPVIIEDEPEQEVYGVRVQLDEIKIIWEEDGYGKGDVYGLVRVSAMYKDGYEYLDPRVEKTDRALLFFLPYKAPGMIDYIWRCDGGDSRTIGNYVDFYFNPAKLHEAAILIESTFADHEDPAQNQWWDNNDHFGGSNIDTILLEDINFFNSNNMDQRILGCGAGVYPIPDLPDNALGLGVGLIFSFRPVSVGAKGKLPEGFDAQGDFLKLDLYPEIPRPEKYHVGISGSSEKWIVGQRVLSTFSPEPMEVRGSDGKVYLNYQMRPKFVSGGKPITNPEFKPWGVTTYHGLVEMPDAYLQEYFGYWYPPDFEQRVKPYQSVLKNIKPVIETVYGQRLAKTPVVQMVRYWKPIEIYRLAAGTSLTRKVSYTKGIKKEEGGSFSISLEAGGSGIGGWFDFKVAINRTFNWNFEYSASTTEELELSLQAPDDQNTVIVVWQLIEQFRIVDENGEVFTDPNYTFKSMEVVSIPTDLVVTEAYHFNAN